MLLNYFKSSVLTIDTKYCYEKDAKKKRRLLAIRVIVASFD